jgi:hypothetical protein
MIMDQIIAHALALIIDDEKCAKHTDERTQEILGRSPHENKDEDAEWWEAKTQAVNELLDMTKLHNCSN